MVDILFHTQDDVLTKPGTVRTIYDPAAGTGGMLSTAYDHLVEMNPKARPVLYGQDINPRSYALCKSDMIVKGQDVDNIYLGDTLTDDGFRTRHFDFLLSNPPFGVAWNTQQKQSPMNTSSAASRDVSVPAYPASRTGHCCFFCT